MKKHYNCYSSRLCGFLMMKGFVLLEMRRDKKSNRNIFIFNDTEQLHESVMEYRKL